MHALDDKSYVRFCTKQNLNKALNTLSGIVDGITSDDVVNDREIQELRDWCTAHQEYAKLHPFTELFPKIDAALEDGILDSDEIADIKWFLEKVLEVYPYYDAITAQLQHLQGMLHGILADGVVDDDEVKTLSKWLHDHEELKGCYPFDEL